MYLAVHWPQDVLFGDLCGLTAGYCICVSNVHVIMTNFSQTYYPYGGLIFLSVGFVYAFTLFVIVKILDIYSDRRLVPDEAISRYVLGVARAARTLSGEEKC